MHTKIYGCTHIMNVMVFHFPAKNIFWVLNKHFQKKVHILNLNFIKVLSECNWSQIFKPLESAGSTHLPKLTLGVHLFKIEQFAHMAHFSVHLHSCTFLFLPLHRHVALISYSIFNYIVLILLIDVLILCIF